MKKIALASILLLLINIPVIFSQEKTAQSPVPTFIIQDGDTIYTVCNDMPTFPGGEEALFEFLSKNINYPDEARAKKISGRVYASFIIDKDGTLKDVQILRSIGHGTDEEVKRVITTMPAWMPGKQDGRTVKVKYTLPVSFGLAK